jgi:hypothetical protein
LSERPHRCRTWVPKGQTPVLQYHFHWKTLSAMAAVTWWNFYFRLFPGAIRRPQIIMFLSHLPRHIPGKLLGSGGFVCIRRLVLGKAFIEHDYVMNQYRVPFAVHPIHPTLCGLGRKSQLLDKVVFQGRVSDYLERLQRAVSGVRVSRK